MNAEGYAFIFDIVHSLADLSTATGTVKAPSGN